jgi:hypothetical protein
MQTRWYHAKAAEATFNLISEQVNACFLLGHITQNNRSKHTFSSCLIFPLANCHTGCFRNAMYVNERNASAATFHFESSPNVDKPQPKRKSPTD